MGLAWEEATFDQSSPGQAAFSPHCSLALLLVGRGFDSRQPGPAVTSACQRVHSMVKALRIGSYTFRKGSLWLRCAL